MVNSGTEATMSAIRLARGYTGRDLLVKFEGCYHGHADALSITVNSDGRPLLIDPGACEYVGPERDIFRGTRSHNTLMVDNADQGPTAN